MPLDSAGLGARVAQARQRSGLTQDELARSTGLDRTAITKIETGARRVTALELARVAETLRERIEWFLSDTVPAVVSHRNMSDPGEPSPKIDDAIDRLSRAVEFVAAHDQRLADLLEGTPIGEVAADVADIESMARTARAVLGFDDAEPAHGLSERFSSIGVLTFVLDLGTETADAASVLLPHGAVALVNGSLRTGRRRLALAHELGHVLLADEYTVDWRVDNGTANNRERAIDRFARALLLPPNSLTTEWNSLTGPDDAGLREASVRIASRYRVDMSTLARRLSDLGLVDSAQAGEIRAIKTLKADIVELDLVVADELPAGELPRNYEASVLRLYTSELVSEVRALDLLLDVWTPDDLPLLPDRNESEIWQYVS
jgi:Zn-dependent peptidase ImmA (M78 family)/DNA-binding XRE family transcriptional regulator